MPAERGRRTAAPPQASGSLPAAASGDAAGAAAVPTGFPDRLSARFALWRATASAARRWFRDRLAIADIFPTEDMPLAADTPPMADTAEATAPASPSTTRRLAARQAR